VKNGDRGSRSTISITLNGDEKTIEEGLTVSSLVESLGLEKDRVAVEKNTEVIRRKSWEQVRLRAGDRVEVVTFVGGGACPEARR